MFSQEEIVKFTLELQLYSDDQMMSLLWCSDMLSSDEFDIFVIEFEKRNLEYPKL